MKKALLIVLGIVAGLSLAFVGLRLYTKSFSPAAVAESDANGVHVKVSYSRPAKKGRLIFGREKDNALVPYGKVWRTGANEATVIELGENLTIAGQPVKAGTYSLYTVPGQGSWKLILNSESGQWGTEYNDGKDVARIEVPIRIRRSVQEQFDIYFEDIPKGINMILSWDQTEAIVAIEHK